MPNYNKLWESNKEKSVIFLCFLFSGHQGASPGKQLVSLWAR